MEIGSTCVKSDLSHEDYLVSEALGSTEIKASRESLAHFKALIDGKKQFSKSTREAFDLGTSAHEIILEGSTDRFIKGPDVSSKAVKEWKAFVEANPDKIVLTNSEYSRVLAMFVAFNRHPEAAKLLAPCKSELSYFSVDHNTGLWVKARPDSSCADYVVDYKTTSKRATMREFANTCAQLGYDISAAHYLAVMEQVNKTRVKDFFWIVQETSAPYELMIYRATPNLLAGARIIRDQLLENIKKAYSANSFPGYPTGIVDLDLPTWAIDKQAEEFSA